MTAGRGQDAGRLPAGRVAQVSGPEARVRGARLPRSLRRKQLLGAAREVFVAQGYHAAVMDEIAERAGVSKPVLYQHFPSKRDLYLALLEQHTDELVAATREALASTTDNKQRVAASLAAFFAFIDSESESFRLVFESDFTSDPQVRELLDRVAREGIAVSRISLHRPTLDDVFLTLTAPAVKAVSTSKGV